MRPPASPSSGRWLLLALLAVLALGRPAARAQTSPQKPGRVNAANRRALRETRNTESPYKDSHLDVTTARLRRGKSTQPQPKTSPTVNYKKGTAPNVKPPGLLGRRKKKR